MKPSTQALERLASRRQELELRLDDLRRALERELGWMPAAKTWILPLTAFASGLALAAWLAARRKKTRAAAGERTPSPPPGAR